MESGWLFYKQTLDSMRPTRSFVILLALLVAGTSGFYAAVHYLSDGFHVSKISATLPVSTAELPVPIKEILSENFFYLGKGSQFYVFESEDGKYVLKFFRMNRYKPIRLPAQLPLPSFLEVIQTLRLNKKEMGLSSLHQSCLLAEQKLREETGLVYLHINKTLSDAQTVVHDPLRRPHSLAIDHYPFLIQKKAEPALSYLSHLLEQGKRKEAEMALADLSALIARRCQKGIKDDDPEIYKNAGFLEGRALFIDVGQFSEDSSLKSPTKQLAEVEKTTRKLRDWLSS